ncbi:hypothetical protein MK805_00640 [Shimazuella sp. AN120528]|uniref:hypothetical protein n=1 Tax=Shimazuella soli TaxID=1892854 RepID=UPI001F0E75F2|nr:hypothetical protein [Shimazuella soli]MCH5583479.1 hypothetical protein [Shimazuella soli]
MSTSNTRSAYSAVKQSWKEYFIVRLNGAVFLLGLLDLILFMGGASGVEIAKKTIVVASFLALFELDMRATKKANKKKNKSSGWFHKGTRWLLFSGLAVFVASYVWMG